jgi:DNA adenine methylase/adenine-specific DNA-methyltransferase
MATTVEIQSTFSWVVEFPEIVKRYPQLRFMGSKYRLLPWIHEVVTQFEFDSALDPFSGSGCVGYMLKAMGKQVTCSDFLKFSTTIARATVENPGIRLDREDVALLLRYDRRHGHFVERTFRGIFFTPKDLRFLDRIWWNIRKVDDLYKKAIAISALVRSCAKRQPRGVFTVAGDPEHYKDGRRDLRLSIEEHFLEQVEVYNKAAFDNGRKNRAICSDVFSIDPSGFDLVYLDPPYVPRSDDNCYIKRYHFLEGLSCYWEGLEILQHSNVKKVKKPYTPFSYRRSALDAFEKMFRLFSRSIIVLSYSSNGYPDLGVLVELMKRHKRMVSVFETPHRYHFGTHEAAARNEVMEYLVVGV